MNLSKKWGKAVIADFECPKCGQVLKDQFSGEEHRCADCGQMMFENSRKNNGGRWFHRDRKQTK